MEQKKDAINFDIKHLSTGERESFILGMITAFGECVGGEAKKIAFSPPLRTADYNIIKDEVEIIAKEMGVKLWYENNEDLKEDIKWWVIYKFDEVLEEYLKLRQQGLNPAKNLQPFNEILSYGAVFGENSEKVICRMRKEKDCMGTVTRILFHGKPWLNENN